MIVQCSKCNLKFDDEFRWTICPHETFAANDGKNNFQHHPESYLERDQRDQQTEEADREWRDGEAHGRDIK